MWHVDAVDEAVDEHGVENGIDEEEPEVSDRVVSSDALTDEFGMLVSVLNARVTSLAVVHVRRFDQEALVAVQIELRGVSL